MITYGLRGGAFIFVGTGATITVGLPRSLIKISNFSPLHLYCRVLQPTDTEIADVSDITVGGNQSIVIDKPEGFSRIRLAGQETETRVHWQHVRIRPEY